MDNSKPAGFWRRLAALFYDLLVLACIWFFATTLAVLINGGQALAPHDPLLSIYLFWVTFAFFGWFWTHGGETLGMKAWKIRLVSADGGAIHWKTAFIRYLLGLLSLACLGLGFFWIIVETEKRSWHDRLSRTRVIRSAITRPCNQRCTRP